MFTICPYCRTQARHRIAFCRTNLRILLHNCGMLLARYFRPWINVVPGKPEDPSPLISYLRVCRSCRRRFLPRADSAYVATCWQCGYSLIGNESGVCPECGHRMSKIQRTLLRSRAREKP